MTPPPPTSKPDHPPHLFCQLHENLRSLAARRLRHHGRHPAIRIVADARVQRDVAQKRDAVLTASVFDTTTAAVTGVRTEDGCGVGTGGTGERGHVLDHAEDLYVSGEFRGREGEGGVGVTYWDVDLLEHVDALYSIF